MKIINTLALTIALVLLSSCGSDKEAGGQTGKSVESNSSTAK